MGKSRAAPGLEGDSAIDRLRASQEAEARRRMEEEAEAEAEANSPPLDDEAAAAATDVVPETEGVEGQAPSAADGGNGRSTRRSKTKGKGKRTMGTHAQPKRQPRQQRDLSEAEKLSEMQTWPAVDIKLLRRDPISGQTPTLGHWVGRHPSDVFSAEGWVREWSGGGRYTMNVFNPSDLTKPYYVQNFELPGEPLEPLDLRREKEQAAAPASAVASSGQPPAAAPDPWGRPAYSAVTRQPGLGGLPPERRWGPEGGRARWDEDEDSPTLVKIVEKLMDQQFGSGGPDYLREQERRDHERRVDEERRDRERREEERDRRREEERREAQQRAEEREREWERRREEENKRWEERLQQQEQQRLEDRKVQEARERDEERRRADEQTRRREEELARERESHKEELRRLEEKHREEAQRSQERFEQLLKEQNQQAEQRQKEQTQQAEQRQKELTDRMVKAEEDRRREMDALQEKTSQKETTTMLERIQTENRQLLERVLEQNKAPDDPILAQVLRGQSESEARSASTQAQLLETIVTQMGNMSGKDAEMAKLLLDVVNPERNLGIYTALSDMATKNVDVVTSLLSSGLIQQLQGEEQSPWLQVVDKIVEGISGGAEAVLAAKQQAAEQPAYAARAAQARAAALANRPPVQAPVRPLTGGAPGAASLGNPGPQPVRLPEAGPMQQPVQVQQHAPAALPPVEATPESLLPEEEPVAAPEEAEPMAVETEGAAAIPLARIRDEIAAGNAPEDVAERVYDYVTFLSRWEMLPPETEEAIFSDPADAVPKLLGAAAASRPEAPPLQVEEEYVEAIIKHFVLIVEQDQQAAAEEAAAAEAPEPAAEVEEAAEEEAAEEEEAPQEAEEE